MRFVYVFVAAMVGSYFLFDIISGLGSPRWVWVYPIQCKGKVLGNLCEGTLGMPLNPSSFHRSSRSGRTGRAFASLPTRAAWSRRPTAL